MSSTDWIRLSRQYLYRAKTEDEISFVSDRLKLPSGREFDYVYVDCPYEVTYVIGIDRNQNVVLIKQHRYLINDFLYEVPAGSPNSGESLEDGARRELQEETGCQVDDLQRLASFYSSVGMTNQKCHIFLGRINDDSVPTALDESEVITTHRIKFELAVAMAERGEIQNVGAAYGILLAAARLRG